MSSISASSSDYMSTPPPDDHFNEPILVSNVLDMLIVNLERLSPNERPYEREVYRLNNELLKEWQERVLDKISKDGKIPVGRAFHSWVIFQEGKGTLTYPYFVENKAIVEADEEAIAFWKSFFESKSLAEMHSYGTGFVSYGWRIIEDYMRTCRVKYMYEKFFSLSDDPLVWEKEHAKYEFLVKNHQTLWPLEQLLHIREKVITLLKIEVKPSMK